jgi:hypothetical protein
MKTDEIIEETFTVLGRRAKDGSLEFWCDYDFENDIESADDYSDAKPSALIDEVIGICESAECEPKEISLMKVERVIRIASEVTFDDARLLEARRAKALSKLTHDEIEALGLVNIATYSKVKFHNAPDEEL